MLAATSSVPGPDVGQSATAGAEVDGAIPYPRAAARIASDFFLRQVAAISQLVDGDLFLGLVFTAMLAANNQRVVKSGATSRQFAGVDESIPDHLRVPISCQALSASLGLPRETGRRYVARLSQRGLCVRIKGGWIVPHAAATTEPVKAVVRKTAADLRQMILALRSAGVDLDQIR